MSRTRYYTTPEVVAMLGGVANYNQVRWAAIRGRVKPRTIGRVRLWTAKEVEQLRSHFAKPTTTEATP
jgi:hypothetical protein